MVVMPVSAPKISDNGIALSLGIYYLLVQEDQEDQEEDQNPTYSVFWYFTLDDPNHVMCFADLNQVVKVKYCY